VQRRPADSASSRPPDRHEHRRGTRISSGDLELPIPKCPLARSRGSARPPRRCAPQWVSDGEHDVIPMRTVPRHHVGIKRKRPPNRRPISRSTSDHARGVWINVVIGSGRAGSRLHSVSAMSLRAFQAFSAIPSTPPMGFRRRVGRPGEHGHGSVGRHEQRQDVEPLETLGPPRATHRRSGVLKSVPGLPAVPRMTVDEGRASAPARPVPPASRWCRRDGRCDAPGPGVTRRGLPGCSG